MSFLDGKMTFVPNQPRADTAFFTRMEGDKIAGRAEFRSFGETVILVSYYIRPDFNDDFNFLAMLMWMYRQMPEARILAMPAPVFVSPETIVQFTQNWYMAPMTIDAPGSVLHAAQTVREVVGERFELGMLHPEERLRAMMSWVVAG